VLGDLVPTTAGGSIMHPPTRCPNGPTQTASHATAGGRNCDVLALPRQRAVVRLLADRCCAPATESAGSVEAHENVASTDPAGFQPIRLPRTYTGLVWPTNPASRSTRSTRQKRQSGPPSCPAKFKRRMDEPTPIGPSSCLGGWPHLWHSKEGRPNPWKVPSICDVNRQPQARHGRKFHRGVAQAPYSSVGGDH
jgi:hypothetical protein